MPLIKPDIIDPAIAAYIAAHSTPPDDVQLALIAVTAERTGDRQGMQIGSDEGWFLEMVTRAVRATSAIEIGTFTGYSALSIARGLSDGGRLIACDINEQWTSIGRTHWEAASVNDRIDLRIGPALDTIRALPTDQRFDVVFIDADKTSYLDYYGELLPRLQPHGVMLVDNTLWSGRVIDDASTDADTMAIREFNRFVAADTRVNAVILSICDGVTMIQPR